MALTKLTKNLIDGTFGTEWVSTIQTSNFTAEAAKGYFVNTTASTITINLPAGVVGTEIVIQDYAGTFATNKVLLNPNGSEKIQGSSTLQGQITTNNATATLIYQDTTKGWTSQDISLDTVDVSWGTPTGQGLTYTVPSPQSSGGDPGGTFPTTTFTATKSGNTISGTASFAGLPSGITATQSLNNSNPGNILTVTLSGVYPSTDSLNTVITLSGLTVQIPLTVDYLVSAGGGGGAGGYGGVGGGGGGAGGLRSSYGNTAGTPAWVNETTLTLTPATNYSVTIGAGSSGAGYFAAATGTNGSNSVFHSITSVGGGGGRSYSPGGGSSSSGGSGAGGTYSNVSAGTADPSPTSGHAGGNGTVNGPAYGGGGGGGAGSAGTNGSSSNGGNAGDGLEVNILGGTGNYYGGGGGGGNDSGTPGTGGSGVGGSGGANGAGSVGTVNTGSGGGGGGGTSAGAVGAGGSSGIVILRYPSGYTISGLSGTTTTVGTDKVTTFTSGTGNIQFN